MSVLQLVRYDPYTNSLCVVDDNSPKVQYNRTAEITSPPYIIKLPTGGGWGSYKTSYDINPVVSGVISNDRLYRANTNQ